MCVGSGLELGSNEKNKNRKNRKVTWMDMKRYFGVENK